MTKKERPIEMPSAEEVVRELRRATSIEDLLTDYTYIPHSGHRPLQREESALGLMYYVARW